MPRDTGNKNAITTTKKKNVLSTQTPQSYAHMHVHTPAISSSRRGLSKRNIGESPMQGTCMTFNFPVANQRKFSSSSKKVILLLKAF